MLFEAPASAMMRRIRKEAQLEFNDLTEEQKTKVLACKNQEELLALAKAEGVKLTDEQLEAISGGWGDCKSKDSEELTC